MVLREQVKKMLEKHGAIRNVYFLACGGSLVDLYPGYYFIMEESMTMHSTWMTAKDFVCNPPKQLGKDSLLIICSHGGNTMECVEAAEVGSKAGAAIMAMTHTKGSKVDKEEYGSIVYDWADGVPEADKPQGITLTYLNELLYQQEKNEVLYEAINKGMGQIDAIIKNACAMKKEPARVFAEKYADEPFLYTMASGASYSQGYGFAICSLQEMQWMDCCYLHSGEYFHGPFEVTDKEHLYILLKSAGPSRVMDERAERFLAIHTPKYEVIDAMEMGMTELDPICMEYFTPMLFYAMTVVYRTALQDKRGHSLDMRRYMGVENY